MLMPEGNASSIEHARFPPFFGKKKINVRVYTISQVLLAIP